MTKLYLAYGANTNLAQMKYRCPTAKFVCAVTLNHHALVFRGVADVIPQRGARVSCALWTIEPQDEVNLDHFEGFPRLYVKKYVRQRLQGRWVRVMLYVMRQARGESLPPKSYEETLRTGYKDCGMPLAQIDAAMRRAEASRVQQHRSGRWAAPTAPMWASGDPVRSFKNHTPAAFSIDPETGSIDMDAAADEFMDSINRSVRHED